MLTATTASAVPHVKQGRARALTVAGGALAAALGWVVEVPVLGIHLTARFGPGPGPGPMHAGAGHIETIVVGQVVGAAVVASLFGWLLLALLERRTPRARRLWVTIAVAALAVSLGLPLALATTSSAAAGLIVLHVIVAAVVIPALARTARTR